MMEEDMKSINEEKTRKRKELVGQNWMEKAPRVLENVETVTGKNFAYITRKTGYRFDILSVTPNLLKRSLKFCDMKTEDKWRINMIKEVTDIKQNVLKLEGEGFSSEELDELVEYISTT